MFNNIYHQPPNGHQPQMCEMSLFRHHHQQQQHQRKQGKTLDTNWVVSVYFLLPLDKVRHQRCMLHCGYFQAEVVV